MQEWNLHVNTECPNGKWTLYLLISNVKDTRSKHWNFLKLTTPTDYRNKNSNTSCKQFLLSPWSGTFRYFNHLLIRLKPWIIDTTNKGLTCLRQIHETAVTNNSQVVIRATEEEIGRQWEHRLCLHFTHLHRSLPEKESTGVKCQIRSVRFKFIPLYFRQTISRIFF